MTKDFEGWHRRKLDLQERAHCPPFRERDVWWCSIGVNVGDEQDGKGQFYSRPVLVIKKFNAHLFVGMPLSTIVKTSKFYHVLNFKGIEQCVLLSQLRLMDAKRLENRVGELPTHEFNMVKEKLKALIL